MKMAVFRDVAPHPDDGGGKVFGQYLSDLIAQNSRKQPSSYTL